MEAANNDLLTKLQGERDWHFSTVFTDKKNVLADNGAKLTDEELEFYIQAYNDRDTTVGEGFFVNGTHFDVHRFHHTNLDSQSESWITGYWPKAGTRDLSASWTGQMVFYLLRPDPGPNH